MSWDQEAFIKEASELFENPIHQKFIAERLPNDGDDLQKICAEGLTQLTSNFDRLFAELTNAEVAAAVAGNPGSVVWALLGAPVELLVDGVKYIRADAFELYKTVTGYNRALQIMEKLCADGVIVKTSCGYEIKEKP